ncbi:MAG: twitching motility protein PilT [Anaerolineaceae bacterium]|nr:MAG: twitching motility protein PilT [Anaerolineaceae bacterium]
MTEILLDTNVLVYGFDLAERDKRAHALTILRELQNSSLGCISVQCLSEFFNAVTRGAKPKLPMERALEYVQGYLLSFPTYLLTPSIVMIAARGVKEHSLSFYDAQIWACALANDIPVIFSEDFQDGQVLEGIRFVNPFAKNFELEKWI